LIVDDAFRRNEVYTDFIADNMARLTAVEPTPPAGPNE
jgi:hypothetical protein